MAAHDAATTRRQGKARRRAALLAIGVACLLGGCASAPPPAPPTPAQKSGASEALTIERHWLESWFKGTPVRIEQHQEGAFDIAVATEFCFDPGQSAVKPALAAVLDKLAESLGRMPLAAVPLIAAPADTVTAPALALQRAQRVRDHLQSRGIAAARLGLPTVAATAAVHLHVTAVAPSALGPAARRDDGGQSPLPPPT